LLTLKQGSIELAGVLLILSAITGGIVLLEVVSKLLSPETFP
jgi:hypothetical protein